MPKEWRCIHPIGISQFPPFKSINFCQCQPVQYSVYIFVPISPFHNKNSWPPLNLRYYSLRILRNPYACCMMLIKTRGCCLRYKIRKRFTFPVVHFNFRRHSIFVSFIYPKRVKRIRDLDLISKARIPRSRRMDIEGKKYICIERTPWCQFLWQPQPSGGFPPFDVHCYCPMDSFAYFFILIKRYPEDSLGIINLGRLCI